MSRPLSFKSRDILARDLSVKFAWVSDIQREIRWEAAEEDVEHNVPWAEKEDESTATYK